MFKFIYIFKKVFFLMKINKSTLCPKTYRWTYATMLDFQIVTWSLTSNSLIVVFTRMMGVDKYIVTFYLPTLFSVCFKPDVHCGFLFSFFKPSFQLEDKFLLHKFTHSSIVYGRLKFELQSFYYILFRINTLWTVSSFSYVYIYIYIYMYRERERINVKRRRVWRKIIQIENI